MYTNLLDTHTWTHRHVYLYGEHVIMKFEKLSYTGNLTLALNLGPRNIITRCETDQFIEFQYYFQ